MLVPQSTDVMKQLQPQHGNFSTYITGLIAFDGRKNIKNINETFTEHKD